MQNEAGGWRLEAAGSGLEAGVPAAPGARSSDRASSTVADLTERALIARIRAQLPPPPPWMLVGIGDDAAVVEPERNRAEVLSVDALVEGVHFDRAFTPARAIGHRALAANLSDLAAMGAQPRLALLSFALPAHLPVADFDDMIGGIAALAAAHRLHVAGGNLTRSPGPLVVDITVVGTVKPRQALTRRGARAGDHIYVSGTIGAAAAGLQMLQSRKLSTTEAQAKHATTKDTEVQSLEQSDRVRGQQDHRTDHQDLASVSSESSVVESLDARDAEIESCIDRYFYPEPRIRTGLLLSRNRAATACMDLSDGLADAVRQIAEASGVGAIIDAGALPIEAGARAWFEAGGADVVDAAISGGDDYELLIGVRPRLRNRLKAAQAGGAPLTRVGTFTADRALIVRRTEGDTPLPAGYRHFR